MPKGTPPETVSQGCLQLNALASRHSAAGVSSCMKLNSPNTKAAPVGAAAMT